MEESILESLGIQLMQVSSIGEPISQNIWLSQDTFKCPWTEIDHFKVMDL